MYLIESQTSFGEPQRESVSVRTSSSTRTSFSTSSSSQPSASRGRLEVQSIRVRPNADLARGEEDAAAVKEEETDVASFGARRDPVRGGLIRNRVRQRRPLRHRGNAEQNY